ncbi:MAG: hypothetical protein ACLFN5_06875, partial [bacterium]
MRFPPAGLKYCFLFIIFFVVIALPVEAAVNIEDYEVDYRPDPYPENDHQTWEIDKRGTYDDLNLFFKELEVEKNYDFVYIEAW